MGERSRVKLAEESRIYRGWVRSRLKTGSVVGWVAETNRGDIVAGGLCGCERPFRGRGRKHLVQPFLLSMYTEPEWRGRGLASRIVNEAVKWANKSGYAAIMLHASPMGRGVYLSARFPAHVGNETRTLIYVGKTPNRMTSTLPETTTGTISRLMRSNGASI